jgi:hypothetical protein
MSGSTLPGANTPHPQIVAAATPNDILAAAQQIPEVKTILTQALTLAATPVGSLLGMIVTWVIAHFGWQVPAGAIPIICGLGIIAGHYTQTKIWPPLAARLSPPAQGPKS